LNLTDFMQGAGQGIHQPGLDLERLHRHQAFTTAPDGKLYQLPDQQFANLYWFRADWFARKDLQDRFSRPNTAMTWVCPLNWSAYEDIADFLHQRREEIDGKRIYGHMDYGKKTHRWAGASPMPGCPWPVGRQGHSQRPAGG
jgi:glycerol transport system substrate-binding protein